MGEDRTSCEDVNPSNGVVRCYKQLILSHDFSRPMLVVVYPLIE